MDTVLTETISLIMVLSIFRLQSGIKTLSYCPIATVSI
jgi:hypothetical protein